MPHTLLDRAVIKVTGEDAFKLLNDTLTGRLSSPMGLEGRWFALLSPQGKILLEGLATEADEAIWLDIPLGTAEAFLKRMRLYRLRAKVEFEDVTASTAVWWAGHPYDDGPSTSWAISYSDNRNSHVPHDAGDRPLGTRCLVPRAEVDSVPVDGEAYHGRRIAAGIAEQGVDFGSEEVFAHDIGMDMLEGIDFAKGCYVGQEVVSRMKHRGTARRRPVIVTGVAADAGSAVIAGGREAGTIGQVVDGAAVAILRLDRITDPAAVTVDGRPVTLTLPAWATYRFGESGAEE